jgi:hypothetical protein
MFSSFFSSTLQKEDVTITVTITEFIPHYCPYNPNTYKFQQLFNSCTCVVM